MKLPLALALGLIAPPLHAHTVQGMREPAASVTLPSGHDAVLGHATAALERAAAERAAGRGGRATLLVLTDTLGWREDHDGADLAGLDRLAHALAPHADVLRVVVDGFGLRGGAPEAAAARAAAQDVFAGAGLTVCRDWGTVAYDEDHAVDLYVAFTGRVVDVTGRARLTALLIDHGAPSEAGQRRLDGLGVENAQGVDQLFVDLGAPAREALSGEVLGPPREVRDDDLFSAVDALIANEAPDPETWDCAHAVDGAS